LKLALRPTIPARERYYANSRTARRGNPPLRQTGSTAGPVFCGAADPAFVGFVVSRVESGALVAGCERLKDPLDALAGRRAIDQSVLGHPLVGLEDRTVPTQQSTPGSWPRWRRGSGERTDPRRWSPATIVTATATTRRRGELAGVASSEHARSRALSRREVLGRPSAWQLPIRHPMTTAVGSRLMVQRTEAPRACGIGTMDLVRPLGMAGIRCAVVARAAILLDRRLHRGRRRRVRG
jgi:hypothetical protein